jgi:class 3 adenylate cyclase
MKKILWVIFSLLWPYLGLTQNKLDSLITAYKSANRDTTKITALLEISYYYRNSNPDTVITIAQKGLVMAQKANFTKGQAWAYNRIAMAHSIQGNYPEALKYAQKSLEIFEKSQIFSGMAACLNILGAVYDQQDNYLKAIEYYQKALTIYKKINHIKGMGICLGNLAGLYNLQGNYPKALETQLQSLKIAEKLENEEGIADNLSSLGNIHYNQGNYVKAMDFYEKGLKIREKIGDEQGIAISFYCIGNIYESKKEYSKALAFYEKGLKLREKIGDEQGMGASLSSIGAIYGKLGQTEKALEFQQRGLAFAQKNEDQGSIAYNLLSISQIYQDQKNYNLSLDYALKSLQVAQKAGLLIESNSASKTLYEVYKSKGEYSQALKHFEYFKQTNDSLFNLEREKKMANLEAKADIEKKELAIQKQEVEIQKQKEARDFQLKINYLIIGGLILMMILSFFIYRSQQKEKKAKELVSKQKEEVSQQKEEIQQINEELNSTLQVVEQERQKSDKLLLNILPYETAQELKEKGSATPQHYDLVSVLFTDFKGFTNAVEQLKPIEVIKELDFCFNKFDEIIEKYGMERIKTIGDAYMAVGGLPMANQTNPYDAVSAGLEIQVFMNQLKQQRESEGKTAWQCRLGIHSGEVIAGVVGTKKFAYDIWGDTVNTASRMESSGEVGKVNISGATYELVKNTFKCAYRGKIEAKNKGEVAMYFVEKML